MGNVGFVTNTSDQIQSSPNGYIDLFKVFNSKGGGGA